MVDYVVYFWLFLASQLVPPGSEAILHFERFNEGTISLKLKPTADGNLAITDKTGKKAVVRIKGTQVLVSAGGRDGQSVDVASDFVMGTDPAYKKGAIIKCKKTGRNCMRLEKVTRGMYRLTFRWSEKERIRRAVLFWNIE